MSKRENVSKIDDVTMQTLNLVVSLYAENGCVAGGQMLCDGGKCVNGYKITLSRNHSIDPKSNASMR